ncbi:MAG: Uma2 family endonuclease [Isosphaeraceae bacterium]
MATGTPTQTETTLALTVSSPRSGLRASPEAFWELCHANPDLNLERDADGEVIVMAPAGMESGGRGLELGRQLGNWNKRTGLGFAFDASAGFTCPDSAVRSADVAWVRRERWEALTREERERFAPIVPDFVAELRSPSDRLVRLREKMREYVKQGVRLGWLIDPSTAKVEIHRPGQPPEVLDRPKSLSGEDVLPSLVIDLKGVLFD